MNKIETTLPYVLTNYELAIYDIAKFFISEKCETKVKKAPIKGGFIAKITRGGLIKNFLGSRTSISITLAPKDEETLIQIETEKFEDDFIKEAFTYILVIPAIKKLGDILELRNLAKQRAIISCEKYKNTKELK